jgi:hypothetical protein
MLPRRLFCLVVTSVALTCASVGKGETYFIDPLRGSIDGSGAADSPWSTLEDVFAKKKLLRAGDVLMLRTGDHGRPVVSGIIDGGEVTIRAVEGHTPRVAGLTFKGAAHWTVSNLVVSPEGAPLSKRKLRALVTIDADSHHVTLRDCHISSAGSIAGWTEADWKTRALDGISSAGPHSTLSGNTLRHVRFGISLGRTARNSVVARNRIEDFMNDGLRGLADDCLFEGNTVKNCYAIDGNHDDGFQSWSMGADGRVGSGVVKGVVLRGNTFISYTDPAQPFKAAMQGIGCFDGMFEDWVIENNLVVTDMWHGIAFSGAKNCHIVNNTVAKNPLDAAPRTPWIQIAPHKKGQPSHGNLVRNNISPTLKVVPDAGAVDHNLVSFDPVALFVDFARFDFRPRSQSAAVGAGTDEAAPGRDFDGRERTSPHTLGAYEAVTEPALSKN